MVEKQFRANIVSPRKVSYPTEATAAANASPWVQANCANSPSARDSSAIAYEPEMAKVILFGGSGDNGALQDLWVWDGQNWEDLTPNPVPSSWPAARYSASMVYDNSMQRIVLFGGTDGVHDFNDLWVWESGEQAWYNMTPDPLPANWPSARNQAGLVDISGSGSFLLFGGRASDNLQDLWLLTSVRGVYEWTDATPDPLPEDWPSARSGHIFVYDDQSNTVLLFGGFNDCGALGDTWLLSVAGGQYNWTLKETPLHLTPRMNSSAAYDPASGQIMLFGGMDGNYLNDTWTWQSSTGWKNYNPPAPYDWSQPNVRCSSVMVYAGQSGLLLFGGVFGTLAFSAELGDTWTWVVTPK